MQMIGQQANRIGGKGIAPDGFMPDIVQYLPCTMLQEQWFPVISHQGDKNGRILEIYTPVIWHGFFHSIGFMVGWLWALYDGEISLHLYQYQMAISSAQPTLPDGLNFAVDTVLKVKKNN